MVGSLFRAVLFIVEPVVPDIIDSSAKRELHLPARVSPGNRHPVADSKTAAPQRTVTVSGLDTPVTLGRIIEICRSEMCSQEESVRFREPSAEFRLHSESPEFQFPAEIVHSRIINRQLE